MSREVLFKRHVPLRHEVDVFVAGGGPAGCAAAATAAQAGALVFLAEGHSCFGGLGTAGMVPAFMRFGDGINFLAAGFGERLLERLIAEGGAGELPQKYDKTGSYAIEVEKLKRIYDAMMSEAGVNFTFGTQLVAVEREGSRVAGVVLAGKSGLFAIRANVYVDATGDGDLCAWAGVPYDKGDENGRMMPGTLCSLWANIDFAAIRRDLDGVPANARVAEAYRNGVFSHCDKHLPGIWRIRKNIGGGNVGHTFDVDGTDERSITKALLWGRRSMVEYTRYFHEYLASGYRDMDLVMTGSLLGIRETRRIRGLATLDIEAFKNRSSFADEIGRFNYPVDIHVARPNDEEAYQKFLKEFQTLRLGEGESYGIRYGALLPQGLENALVAGRCISSDRAMQASVRVMPGCYITGQAAGMAAALAAADTGNTHAINTAELRNRLRAIGAYLP